MLTRILTIKVVMVVIHITGLMNKNGKNYQTNISFKAGDRAMRIHGSPLIGDQCLEAFTTIRTITIEHVVTLWTTYI